MQKRNSIKRKSVIFTAIFGLTAVGSMGQVQLGNDIDGETINDRSGFAVSMPDAQTIAIGAPENDDNGSQAGQVRVYEWNGNSWSQKGDDIDGEAAGDLSGSSVSMPDANTVAIGAPQNDGIGTVAGHVRVFEWIGSAWVQKGEDIDGEAASDLSGSSVSMPDANTVAIGASGNSGSGFAAGHVRIFEWNGSAWAQKGGDIDGEGVFDQSGNAVSMPDAATVAIGAFGNDAGLGDAGHVRVFSWDGNNWVQKGVDIDGEAIGDMSGSSVSMPDENTVAIGAPENDGVAPGAGHVRVYTWDGTSWIQKGNDIEGESESDQSGFSVSMPNADVLAIGGIGNSDGGMFIGQTRIYDWNGSNWVQRGMDLNGEAMNDQSGHSVSMPNENTVAIGAIQNDGNGNEAGHVRIYGFGPVSVQDIGFERALKVYPNPGKGIYQLEFNEVQESLYLALYSLDGKMIYTKMFAKAKTPVFDIKGPAGVYILHVSNDRFSRTLRVVKNE